MWIIRPYFNINCLYKPDTGVITFQYKVALFVLTFDKSFLIISQEIILQKNTYS